ncbi:MAG: DDE-type integrase/transposase/recombinase [Steroidobacteraceae bacterium]
MRQYDRTRPLSPPRLYLAAVLNVYSRAIVGWAMGHTLGGQLATDALAMAISRRGVPELVHSDRGSTPRLNWSSQHRFGMQRVAPR